MSRFANALAATQSLVQVAAEEASRHGRREVLLEDLLVSLTLDATAAGHALRAVGLGTTTAQQAITRVHEAQLASLGVAAQTELGPITFHETEGYEISAAVNRVFQASAAGKNDGTQAAVLRVLLGEPSGQINAVLTEAGITEHDVIAALNVRLLSPTADPRPERGTMRATASQFIPAPIAGVWALVSEPRRMPEWNTIIETVTEVPEPVAEGARFVAIAATTDSTGRPLKMAAKYRRRGFTVTQYAPPALVEYELTYPDTAKASAQNLSFELAPSNDGTMLTVTSIWRRPQTKPITRILMRPIAGLLRPFTQWLARLQLQQIATAVARVFR